MDNILECRGITKKFGEFAALDNVSVEVPQGGIFGLLGPNGAGKTTLIRIVNRITIPTEGKVLYAGSPMNDMTVRSIGYLPEERGLYKKMKVGEQCMYLARLKGLSNAQATAELKKWFIRFNIPAWWNKKVEELSKGMAQKIQFITTVVHKPSLLILDEPFSGFDPINAQVIRNEILRLKDEGTTVILSTHNMESVEELCDNIALINKSHLVITGATNEIRRNYGSDQVEMIFTGDLPAEPKTFAVNSFEKLRDADRVVLDINQGLTTSDVLAEIVGSAQISSFQRLMPRMNDIFIKLVSE